MPDDPAMPPVLSCTGLTKSFDGRTVVADLSLTIDHGETYGLLGPNGAGKTTAISMICGLLRRDAGTVVVDGTDLDDDSRAARSAIGYVPQEIAVYPDLSAAENLSFFGRLQGMGGRRLAGRVGEVLETIGLTDRAGDRSERLSGGMTRRLNIGIGLLHEPSLLVLDEPTVGVDPQSRDAILASVERLGAAGIGVLYTTHYMEEAERLCDRVGIIDEGVLVAEGAHQELVRLVDEHHHVRLGLDGPAGRVATALRSIPDVTSVAVAGQEIDIELVDSARSLPAVLGCTADHGANIHSVELVTPDLESVFLHLTGRALRE